MSRLVSSNRRDLNMHTVYNRATSLLTRDPRGSLSLIPPTIPEAKHKVAPE
jgi:hypothetical protein